MKKRIKKCPETGLPIMTSWGLGRGSAPLTDDPENPIKPFATYEMEEDEDDEDED